MKILVTGKNGQLGLSIQKFISNFDHYDFTFVGRDELDLSSSENISKYFDANSHFDVVINCAAYTAVDKAECEADLADQINHLAVKQMSQLANSYNIKLIHISTDYVFDGNENNSYLESDHPNPINIYGKTKLQGETAVLKAMHKNAIIIRTSWVYSEFGNNFVKTMLRHGDNRDEISVVSDQIGSPTFATDLAKAILSILNHKDFLATSFPSEIYHFSNLGEISWHKFTLEIFKLANLKCEVIPISSGDYKTAALRPKNTTLNREKIINQFNLHIPDWQKSLQDCLKNLL